MKSISLSRALIHSGDLILVNRDYPYKENMADSALVPIGTNKNKIFLERRFAEVLTRLMDDISAWKKIKAVSGWRSQQEQEQLYSDSLVKNGEDFTAKYVAIPQHSEHQTGFAVDLALIRQSIDSICPYFPYTGACGRFRGKAGRFGLIERYPKGKENITGIAHEPWHFRYVGSPHALIIEQLGCTLEEYHVWLKKFQYKKTPLKYNFGGRKTEISYIAAEKEDIVFEIEDDLAYSVSGNNVDGFVITTWRVGK